MTHLFLTFIRKYPRNDQATLWFMGMNGSIKACFVAYIFCTHWTTLVANLWLGISLDELNKWMDMERETNYHMCYSEGLANCQGTQIWPKSDPRVTRRQRPMRALVPFTLQRNMRTNMCRTRLLGCSPQPTYSGWPAGFISTCFYLSNYLRHFNENINHLPAHSWCVILRYLTHSLKQTFTEC